MQVLGANAERLVLATILGGLIGLERQFRHKAAGLRTNVLICFGAAMFTILSAQMADKFGGDHTRIAARSLQGSASLERGQFCIHKVLYRT